MSKDELSPICCPAPKLLDFGEEKVLAKGPRGTCLLSNLGTWFLASEVEQVGGRGSEPLSFCPWVLKTGERNWGQIGSLLLLIPALPVGESDQNREQADLSIRKKSKLEQ